MSLGTSPSSITFGWQGVKDGLKLAPILSTPAAVFGLAYGVYARQSGLNLAEALAMSLSVFAGASQFAVTGLYTQSAPLLVMLVAAFAINVRFFLQGAALQPYIRHLPMSRILPSLFLLADGNWAYTLKACKEGRCDVAMLPAAGLTIAIPWMIFTYLGHAVGAGIADPRMFGLDFILYAMFAAMLPRSWSGRLDLVGWGVAALGAVAMMRAGYPEWGIAVGALSGSLAGGVARVRQH